MNFSWPAKPKASFGALISRLFVLVCVCVCVHVCAWGGGMRGWGFWENAVCSQSMAYYIVPTGPMQSCTVRNDQPILVFLMTDLDAHYLYMYFIVLHCNIKHIQKHSGILYMGH